MALTAATSPIGVSGPAATAGLHNPQRTAAPLKLWPTAAPQPRRYAGATSPGAASCLSEPCRPCANGWPIAPAPYVACPGAADTDTRTRSSAGITTVSIHARPGSPRRRHNACHASGTHMAAASASAPPGAAAGAPAAARPGRACVSTGGWSAPMRGGTGLTPRSCRPRAGGGGDGDVGGATGRASAVAATAVAAASAGPAAVSPAVLRIAEGLPIRECLEEVLLGLDRSSGLVLQAPPGAGKTTVVPLALLRHNPGYLASGERILVLEPRRVAAKGAARRMAASLGEPVGGTVGYRVRLDSKVSSSTRIEVVTEGILLRRLQHDPELAGVGAVVFDEFHERNLDADVALALCLDVQRLARPDLRLVVMSATLGGGLGDRVRHLIAAAATGDDGPLNGAAAGGSLGGGADADEDGAASGLVPLVVSEGRSYPVSTFHLGRPDPTERGSLERAMADAVARALKEERPEGHAGGDGAGGGDVLAFLPGVGEIRKVERLLEEEGTARKYGVRVLQLHGNMPPDEQDEVLRPPTHGSSGSRRRQRRVILATPIAESSVTIDGVTAVVDSGLRRAPQYDPATAVNRLDTIFISDASAEQRRGRAGRTAPGRCYRLWSERDLLAPVSEPEILTADLTPTALELALWGSPDGSGLPWLDAPPGDLMAAGRELLQDLGALEPASGRPTAHGRVLARLGVHPRWGHAVLRGAALGAVELAAVVATMLGSERDLLRGSGAAGGGGRGGSADIMVRLEALARDERGLDRAAASRVLQGARSMAAMAAATAVAAARRAAAAAPSGAGTPSYGADSDDGDDATLAAVLAAAGDLPPLESADASQDDEGGDGGNEDDNERADGGEASPAMLRSAAGGGGGGGGGPVTAAFSARGPSTASAAVSAASASSSRASFEAAWREQLLREGLVGALVAAAYPDRIAERRDRSNKRAAFTLASGQVVRLPSEDDPLGRCDYIAVAEIGGVGPASNWRRDGGGNDTVRAAAGLNALAIERYLKDMIQERDVVFWASGSKAVVARRQKRLGCLVLGERSGPVSDAAALPALLQGFKELGGVRNVGLSRELEAWRQRVIWLRSQALAPTTTPSASSSSTSSSSSASASTSSSSSPSPASRRLAALPDLSDAALLATARQWLGPHLAGVRNKSDMLKLGWNSIIKSLVPWELQQVVEAEAPAHLLLPTGTRALVDYSGGQPVVRCRLQEVFGLPETPRLAGGRVPLTLELLSPGGQPAAVTSDLASFWCNAYSEVRRELRGRYPRHVWPEDPLQAEATRLTKKQLERVEAQAAAAAAAGGGAGSGVKAGNGTGTGAAKKKGTAGGGGGKKK